MNDKKRMRITKRLPTATNFLGILLSLFLFRESAFSQFKENENGSIQRTTVPGALDFPKSILERSIQATCRVDWKRGGTPSEKPELRTAFFIHPSGLVLGAPDGILMREAEFHDSNDKPFQCGVVSRVSQLGMMMMKARLPEPVVPVTVESSASLDISSSVYSVSSLFGKCLVIRRGFFLVRLPVQHESVETTNSLFLDLPLESENLGSPIFNTHGKIIGAVLGIRPEGQVPMGFAIPTEVFLPEIKKVANTATLFGRVLDLAVRDNDRGELIICGPIKDSAAEKYGLKVGDRLTAIGPWTVNNETDFWLSTLAWCLENDNKAVPLTIQSSGTADTRIVELPWIEQKLQPDRSFSEDLKPGCRTVVTDKWNPAVRISSGWSEVLTCPGFSPNTKCELSGFIQIPREGSYAFYVTVPGTAKLKIGRDFVIEKNHSHPKMVVAGRGFFSQGLYRFSLEVNADEAITTRSMIGVETPADFLESKLPSPLPQEWIWCEEK